MALPRDRPPPAAAGPVPLPPGNPRVVNRANALTLLRLLLVPVFLVVLFTGGGHLAAWRYAACAVFVLATATDRVDGRVARRRGLVTEVGKVADPIADKALAGAALIGLSVLGALPWWVTGLVLAREVGVTALRFVVIRHGVIPVSGGGKVKATVQALAVALYLLPLTGWPASLRWWVLLVAVTVTVVTGADYLLRAVRLRRGRTRPRSPARLPRAAVPGADGGVPTHR